jgi:hypothetical protein
LVKYIVELQGQAPASLVAKETRQAQGGVISAGGFDDEEIAVPFIAVPLEFVPFSLDELHKNTF